MRLWWWRGWCSSRIDRRLFHERDKFLAGMILQVVRDIAFHGEVGYRRDLHREPSSVTACCDCRGVLLAGVIVVRQNHDMRDTSRPKLLEIIVAPFPRAADVAGRDNPNRPQRQDVFFTFRDVDHGLIGEFWQPEEVLAARR